MCDSKSAEEKTWDIYLIFFEGIVDEIHKENFEASLEGIAESILKK